MFRHLGKMSGKVIRVAEPLLGYNKIEFTWHAMERMRIRGVSENDVLSALRLSNRQVPGKQARGRVRIRWNKTARYRIDVVYEKRDEALAIITVVPFGGKLTP